MSTTTPRETFTSSAPSLSRPSIAASKSPLVSSVPGTITTAELNDLTNGVAYEVVDWTPIPVGMNAAAANAFLDNLHAARQAETQPQRQAQLNYWGFVRT